MTDISYKVELVKGDFRAVIEGDKDFVSEKLDTVIEFAKHESVSKNEPIFKVVATSTPQNTERLVEEKQNIIAPNGRKLEQAICKLCISQETVSSYVYLGEDGVTPRMMRPDALPLQDVILLTCALIEEIKGEKVHDHSGTKKRLEKDRVDTTRWRDALVKLRDEGMIKDVGNKERYRDFELTPRAFTELRSKFGVKAGKDVVKTTLGEQQALEEVNGASGQ